METDFSSEDKKYFGSIFKQINTKFNRCLWPGESCSDSAIRAHSIQNSGVLDLLCVDNHVIMPKAEITIEKGPNLIFEKIGRNKATTFTGLCDKHDSILFDPIDNYKFDANNEEKLFLLAYRSVLRELHTKMKTGIDIQTQYMKGCELGKFNVDAPDEPMIMAKIALAEAYTFYLYKTEFDKIYLKRNFEQIVHQVDLIKNIAPSIAVSSVLSFIDNMRHIQDRKDPKGIVLNIFPSDDGTYIIFSYRKEHENNLLPHLDRILNAEKYYKLYLVSKLILMHCENVVMSPAFYQKLSESKIELLKSFFMKNLSVDKADIENVDLYLFN
ncbi:MAG: hypothetical protein JRJ27_21650 [Deltaproteobacteria bacterium]|nr:hypothetical protein [Deltaproteobacteria bacterium]